MADREQPGLWDQPADRGPEPPDQPARELIESDLDTTMLVEAAAGTGKTTSMMRRMVALLAAGVCEIDTLAAVTFTRKATAELRARFQVALEKESQKARGTRRENLERALARLEQCFIGTIHSLCGRLLRERPIEAGVDVAFEEIDEDADFRLRRAAWDEFVARLHAAGDPVLGTLDELGLELGQLKEIYVSFADYPDVEEWPAEPVDIDEELAERARGALREYAAHMERLAAELPRHAGNDELIPFYATLPRQLRNTRLASMRELMRVLEGCTTVNRMVQSNWPGGRPRGRQEWDRWRGFLAEYAEPLVGQWRRKRYVPVLDVLTRAVTVYDELRAERGVLSYQDLLMKAAALLRDHPHVRRYFRRRFTHVLVDEFQDTDPVQAEAMLLLTAQDVDEPNWRRCRPEDGSLFVVGDPKQSIYRFRRADIVTYNEVREIIRACGRIVTLTANFRSVEPVITWVNGVSGALFPEAGNYSPEDRKMHPVRAAPPAAGRTGVWRLDLPPDKKADALSFEAEAIARVIRDALDRGDAAPGDFLVLTWVRDAVTAVAGRLQSYGVAVEVTGGAAVNEMEDVALLHTILAAVVEADNPVALVGALRSALFGISDPMLYQFARADGVFNFRFAEAAAKIAGAEPIARAYARLDRYSGWMTRLQPVAAVERIAADLGLLARAAAHPDGPQAAGALCKAIELLRADSAVEWTPAALVEHLWQIVDPDRWPPERHDGISLSPHEGRAVRVMNLHQAKGLEAPIVILADGCGRSPHRPDLHIDRLHATVRGFLRVRATRRGDFGTGRVLAVPDGWDAHEQEEQGFLDAERRRLLYVACTRAGTQLVISSPPKQPRWDLLAVAANRALKVPDAVTTPTVDVETIPPDAPARFEAEVRDRWGRLVEKTYDVKRMKAVSVTGTAPGAAGEHGTEWGTVIHVLLEAAMDRPEAALGPLAEEALRAHDLDPRRADEAVALVKSVTRSPLWERAGAAPQRFTEVPLQVMQATAGAQVDTIVRGVIDLVFREAGGWVIVDYKTDDRPGESVEPLVAHYRTQVEMYAETWQRLVDEPVSETGLFFVNTGEYRVVGAPATAD